MNYLKNRLYVSKKDYSFIDVLALCKRKFVGYTGDYVFTDIKVAKDYWSLPIGLRDRITNYEDLRIGDELSNFPDFKLTLREEQKKVYDEVIHHNDNVVIHAKTDFGKTIVTLAIAAHYKYRTLIMVNKISLLEQWKNEIKKALGITPSVISGGSSDWRAPIVIGVVNTLANRSIPDIYGTVIVDEVHNLPSNRYIKVINSLSARIKIGVSATIERKDGKHTLIKDYIGSKVVKPNKVSEIPCVVTAHYIGVKMPYEGDWANCVNELYDNDKYNDVIIKIIKERMSQGRTVLLVTDRKINAFEIKYAIGKSAMVIGSTKINDREVIHNKVRNGEINVLIGTKSIYKEGISIPQLDCLVLGAPVVDNFLLEQLVGRVNRENGSKKIAYVDDIVLDGIGFRQFEERKQLYVRKKYEIKTRKW